jgi:hypothetical protein
MNRLLALLISCGALTAVAAGFEEDIRQAFQQVGRDVQAALEENKALKDTPLSLLPIGGDREGYIEGLLKMAVTNAGLTYVEGKTDPFWDEVMKEVEWDERKADMLDQATLVKFGKLSATKLLMYGVVRDASSTPQRAYVELELHVSSLETKQHVWGKLFPKRYLLGKEPEAITLDPQIRDALRRLVAEDGVKSLNDSPKLRSIKSVVIVPLAQDSGGYVTGLVRDMLSKTTLVPKGLDVSTVADAMAAARDKPGEIDAILRGAIRDVSRKPAPEKNKFGQNAFTVTAEVQLQLQAAASNDVLWSDTLLATADTFEGVPGKVNPELAFKDWLWQNKTWIIAIVAAMFLFALFMRMTSRGPR